MHSPLLHLIYLIITQIPLIIYDFSQGDSSWTGRYSVRSLLPEPMQMPMRFPGLRGLLPFLREEISLLSSLLCNAWIRIQSFQPITDRSIQFANQKSYYHCDKIWEKISVSRNKIKKLICFSLLLIFVRQADTKKASA